jgi:hypothetical protein
LLGNEHRVNKPINYSVLVRRAFNGAGPIISKTKVPITMPTETQTRPTTNYPATVPMSLETEAIVIVSNN